MIYEVIKMVNIIDISGPVCIIWAIQSFLMASDKLNYIATISVGWAIGYYFLYLFDLRPNH